MDAADLLSQAKSLGAVIYGDSLCVPAHALTNFLNAATNAGWKARYIECLYFYEPYGAAPDGTQPDLEFSRDFLPGQSVEAFIANAARLSAGAIEYAASRHIRSYFQIGLEPELDLSGANLAVRC